MVTLTLTLRILGDLFAITDDFFEEVDKRTLRVTITISHQTENNEDDLGQEGKVELLPLSPSIPKHPSKISQDSELLARGCMLPHVAELGEDVQSPEKHVKDQLSGKCQSN